MKIFKSGGEIMMEYINIFGAISMLIIMIPNIIYAIKNRDAFANKWTNKTVEILEQVGRIGCFGFTVFNIPGTWIGWWSDEAFAIALSVIPSAIFLFSGIMSRSILLIISSILFAPAHIWISYKNTKC